MSHVTFGLDQNQDVSDAFESQRFFGMDFVIGGRLITVIDGNCKELFRIGLDICGIISTLYPNSRLVFENYANCNTTDLTINNLIELQIHVPDALKLDSLEFWLTFPIK